MMASKTFKILGVEHIGIAMNDNEKIESFLRLLRSCYSKLFDTKKAEAITKLIKEEMRKSL